MNHKHWLCYTCAWTAFTIAAILVTYTATLKIETEKAVKQAAAPISDTEAMNRVLEIATKENHGRPEIARIETEIGFEFVHGKLGNERSD